MSPKFVHASSLVHNVQCAVQCVLCSVQFEVSSAVCTMQCAVHVVVQVAVQFAVCSAVCSVAARADLSTAGIFKGTADKGIGLRVLESWTAAA